MNRILITVLFCCLTILHIQSQDDLSKLSEKLQWLIAQPNVSRLSIIIVLEEQIDYAKWETEALEKRADLTARQRALVHVLKDISQNSGQDLYQYLLNSGQAEKSSLKKRWIVNSISGLVDSRLIPALAARSDVKWIGLNSRLLPTYNCQDVLSAMPVPDKAEKGLRAIGADLMWKLGYTGYGRLVFVPDTGTDPSHPAIKNQYNGLYNGNRASWYTLESSSPAPVDCDRHGTHVTGTILGLDKNTNDTLGVAFNARWMAGGILCGIGSEDNLGAFEWALDPDGNPDTTEDIPDVINNSWYDPEVGANECFSAYVPLLKALELAGVAVVFSAGNDGPEPGTITPPHNININVVNSFTVGALNGNVPTYPIASFSSNGPSKCSGEGSLKIKPEVSAPGVQVRSCVPGNEYAFLSGTSMAAPHVAGAILLLKEAFPYLGGRELKLALYETAIDLGEPGEDNRFGMGIINVYQAYLKLVADGHMPVPGRTSRDAMLLDVKAPPLACNTTYAPEVLVENGGTDTIFSLKFEIQGTTLSRSMDWSGVIPPGEKLKIDLVAYELPENDEISKFSISSVNNLTDDRQLNNYRYVRIKSTTRASAATTEVTATDLCKGSKFFLEGPEINGSDGMTIKWFDSPYDGKLIGEGQKLELNNNIKGDVYAELRFKDRFGVDVHAQGDITYPNVTGEGLVFDAEGPFTLDSVSVYSKETGIRDFYLYNEAGDSITSSRKFINKTGINRIKLNWEVPAGNNYRIVKTSGKPLGMQSGIQSFPIISHDGIVSINTGTDGNNYHMFYDWRISYDHPCGRIRYPLNIKTDSVAGALKFELSQDTLKLPDQRTLYITDQSTGILSYHWDMGDGNNYTSRDVAHDYLTEGTYNITLNAVDTSGCPMAEKTTVKVLLSTASADLPDTKPWLKIRPNPAQDHIIVSIPDHGSGSGGYVEIMDNRGITVRRVETGGKTVLNVNISDLLPGLYYLRPSTDIPAKGISFVRVR